MESELANQFIILYCLKAYFKAINAGYSLICPNQTWAKPRKVLNWENENLFYRQYNKLYFVTDIQAKGVHRIAVGIGKKIKSDELETIAGSPDRVVTAKSFDKLKKELDEIREKSCRKYSINFSLMSNCSYHVFSLFSAGYGQCILLKLRKNVSFKCSLLKNEFEKPNFCLKNVVTSSYLLLQIPR